MYYVCSFFPKNLTLHVYRFLRHFPPYTRRSLHLCTMYVVFFQKISPSTFIPTSKFIDFATLPPPPRLLERWEYPNLFQSWFCSSAVRSATNMKYRQTIIIGKDLTRPLQSVLRSNMIPYSHSQKSRWVQILSSDWIRSSVLLSFSMFEKIQIRFRKIFFGLKHAATAIQQQDEQDIYLLEQDQTDWRVKHNK